MGLDTGPYQGFDFLTTRGSLNLSGIAGANLQITTPVPEPETYALMAVGLAGVVVSMRRNKRRERHSTRTQPLRLAQV